MQEMVCDGRNCGGCHILLLCHSSGPNDLTQITWRIWLDAKDLILMIWRNLLDANPLAQMTHLIDGLLRFRIISFLIGLWQVNNNSIIKVVDHWQYFYFWLFFHYVVQSRSWHFVMCDGFLCTYDFISRVHPMTNEPHKAWQMIAAKQAPVTPQLIMDPNHPISPDKVVCQWCSLAYPCDFKSMQNNLSSIWTSYTRLDIEYLVQLYR